MLNYKKPAFWIILIVLILCIASAVCFLTDWVARPEKPTAEFTATVVQSSATWIVVEPDLDTPERNSADRISVSLYTHYSDGDIAVTGIIGEFNVGDRIRIIYDGMIAETYPAQIYNVYDIQTLP